jgi:plastocyanin
MRSISLSRRRGGLVAIGAAATATLLAAALLSSAVAAGHGDRRVDRRANGARVEISEFAFHPQTLHVKPGTSVVFANHDTTTHTATRRGSFATGRIRPGHSATVKLQRAGVYAYHCSIHNFMHGKIVVR